MYELLKGLVLELCETVILLFDLVDWFCIFVCCGLFLLVLVLEWIVCERGVF